MENRFFKLPLALDVSRLRQDLAICEAERWAQHFNTRDYDGEWTGIALRSVSGGSNDIYAHSETPGIFTNTPLLEKCVYFKAILSQLACDIETVRLLALSPGSQIKTHRDPGLGYSHGAFRLHLPIYTDDQVLFRVDGCDLQMQVGECWYADFDLPHSVEHKGTERRIHLVIDGRRNAWSDAWFGSAGYDFEAERRASQPDPETLERIIAQLSLMDTDTARALIAQYRGS